MYRYLRDKKTALIAAAAFLCAAGIFLYQLGPSESGKKHEITISKGDSLRRIAIKLKEDGAIRSGTVFEWAGVLSARGFKLKPGRYSIDGDLSAFEILDVLSRGPKEVSVVVPEGSTILEIDEILSKAGVTSQGAFSTYAKDKSLEGKLYPDTYKFFEASSPEAVARSMQDTFAAKAEPLLAADPANKLDAIILASIVEKEVSGDEDRRIVAGIAKKRMQAKMRLEMDATVCYIKLNLIEGGAQSCYPMDPLDFKRDSPYNTYLYSGLPPGPIGNPGASAIFAALHPQESPYWFYLSDPRTHKTLFSVTYDDHLAKRARYLGV